MVNGEVIIVNCPLSIIPFHFFSFIKEIIIINFPLSILNYSSSLLPFIQEIIIINSPFSILHYNLGTTCSSAYARSRSSSISYQCTSWAQSTYTGRTCCDIQSS